MTPEQQKAIAIATARKRKLIEQSQDKSQKSYQNEPAEQGSPSSNKGNQFFERLQLDIEKRTGMRDDIRAARSRGEQGMIESAFQEAGKVGGGIMNDLAGNLISEGGQGLSAITPDAIEDPIKGAAKNVGSYIINSPVGDMALHAAAKYGDFSEKHPRAARNIDATANLGGILAAAQPAKTASVVNSTVAKPAKEASQKLVNKAIYKEVLPSSEQLRKKGGELFQLADQKGGALRPDLADKFFDDVLKVQPQTSAGKVFKGESPVSKIMDEIPGLKGQPLTLQAAKEVDEALGDLAYGTMDKFGKLNADGKKFLDMQSKLRGLIDSADETMLVGGREGFDALKDARKLWSSSLKLRDVERIIDNAQYFEQPTTALKTGFRQLLRNPDRIKGYSVKEVKALRKAAQTGVVTDFFRLAGSGLGPVIAGGGGFAAAGPLGATAAIPAYMVQQGAKAAGTARQVSKAKGAAAEISRGSGMAKKVPRISEDQIRAIMRMPPKEAKAALNALE